MHKPGVMVTCKSHMPQASKALALGKTKHHTKVSAAIYSEPHLTSGEKR